MVSWENAKGKQAGSDKQKREIERVTLGNGETKIRLIGDVMPRYCYWVVTKEGRKMPLECLQFDRETETFNPNIQDPFKELDPDVYADKPQFAYVCNVIDRKDNRIKLLDLRSTIYAQIVEYARNPEYGSPADSKTGYDITIKKEKTGPLPQNVRYTVVPARSSKPLTDEEVSAELYDLSKIFKRQSYAEQKQWLLDNTTLFAGAAGDEFKAEGVDDLA
jgi:hypothetical protein